MTSPATANIVQDSPLGDALNTLRSSLISICGDRQIARSLEAFDVLDEEDLRVLALPFISTRQSLSAAGLLPSKTGRGTLRNDLRVIISAVASDDFDFDRIKPLLKAAIAEGLDDAFIWSHIHDAVTESTPPPRPIAPSIQQTPLSQNTSGLVNSSEFRQNVDPILKLELEHLYAGLPNFHQAFFRDVPDLDRASKAVFQDFLNSARVNFTPHYKLLIPWVNRLRRKVFPNGERWKKQEPRLYESMTDILRQAQKDIEEAST
ncbi:hypothetical protein TOPH_03900 [Tolypocladium ophioglossoides CBS 100239]|uniref:Uncharacterized protein n=1 Tax=Tolypocladium ophioglossoides (strain CBS 100239) TaxID=1163406 RepID=A0A0L0NBB9_TOLOC|nr:hypothetical protein TOPH_03900 [Tolypocladium ophioglossoides CBS 100239]